MYELVGRRRLRITGSYQRRRWSALTQRPYACHVGVCSAFTPSVSVLVSSLEMKRIAVWPDTGYRIFGRPSGRIAEYPAAEYPAKLSCLRRRRANDRVYSVRFGSFRWWVKLTIVSFILLLCRLHAVQTRLWSFLGYNFICALIIWSTYIYT